jgi:MFS family permease
MLKRIIYRLLRHRHFWRDASFDELSEIYTAMLFRSLALGMVGIFIPVFLFTTGYTLSAIFTFFIYFFATRTVMDIGAGYLVARVGPKHTILVSYVLQIMAALLFLTLPTHHWPLFLPALIWGASNSLFFIAFHVDFSKIKHSVHGGKELGYVTIMERIGQTIGPLV